MDQSRLRMVEDTVRGLEAELKAGNVQLTKLMQRFSSTETEVAKLTEQFAATDAKLAELENYRLKSTQEISDIQLTLESLVQNKEHEIAGEYLTEDNTQKRCRYDEEGSDAVFKHVEEENAALRVRVAALEENSQNLTQQLEKGIKDAEQHMKIKRMKILSDLLISVSKAEREEARRKVRQDSLKLGNVKVNRGGTFAFETWEDGKGLKDLNAGLKKLLAMKEAMEMQEKGRKHQQDTAMQEVPFYHDEMWKSRLAGIKREEEELLRKKEHYELKKSRLIREMKRIRDEDDSVFSNFQILNQRYALLNLLGKGGYAEVYKDFDLLEYKYVACKLHSIDTQWSEEKKASYLRHMTREYDIHKMLIHSNIVRLWEMFEIDNNTFCTVLEYCSELVPVNGWWLVETITCGT